MFGQTEYIVSEWYPERENTYNVTDNAVFTGHTPKQLAQELRRAADEIEQSTPGVGGESYKYKAILNVNGVRVEADIRNLDEVTHLVRELMEEIHMQFSKY